MNNELVSIIFFVILGLIGWIIVGLVVVGSPVLLVNVLPAPHPIRALSIVVIHLISLLSCTPIIILLFGIDDKFYKFYLDFLMFKGVTMLMIGCSLIAGLLTYAGGCIWWSKIWKGPNQYFLLPLRLVISVGVMLIGWIPLSGGMAYLFLFTAMQGGG